MGWYIARRLGAALITVWIVATAGFLLVEIIPGDPQLEQLEKGNTIAAYVESIPPGGNRRSFRQRRTPRARRARYARQHRHIDESCGR